MVLTSIMSHVEQVSDLMCKGATSSRGTVVSVFDHTHWRRPTHGIQVGNTYSATLKIIPPNEQKMNKVLKYTTWKQWVYSRYKHDSIKVLLHRAAERFE